MAVQSRILGGEEFRLRVQLLQGGQIKFWALGGAGRSKGGRGILEKRKEREGASPVPAAAAVERG